ncbi:hypothetical protein RF11_04503 [Thelohanellus kitauei]|uniref:Uncharacterized protein n=1 Tax=Thelohanellus kitauei TaxID=669202 RepID=A0A0C2ND93_THEKT|nr:hypothetical protein RF11_04503 [Thelohanellus kitauei]
MKTDFSGCLYSPRGNLKLDCTIKRVHQSRIYVELTLSNASCLQKAMQIKKIFVQKNADKINWIYTTMVSYRLYLIYDITHRQYLDIYLVLTGDIERNNKILTRLQSPFVVSKTPPTCEIIIEIRQSLKTKFGWILDIPQAVICASVSDIYLN